MNTEIQVINMEDHAMTPEIMQKQVNVLQETMRQVMQKDVHYGVIPGCGTKPTLLKPGAEKICTTFRLSPTYEIHAKNLEHGHREYEMICTLTHIPSGQRVAQGVGLCSSMESKYRYRKAELICPECGNAAIFPAKPEYNNGKKGWFCWKKKGGCDSKFSFEDSRIVDQPQGKTENEDLADCFNTVLKMAKKRAHVDAVLTATAASDIFTQDIEEIKQNADVSEQPKAATKKQPQQRNADVDPVERDKAAIRWIDNLVKNASKIEDWNEFQTTVDAQSWMLPEHKAYFNTLKSAWDGDERTDNEKKEDDLPF